MTWCDDSLCALGVAHNLGAQSHLVGRQLVVHSDVRAKMNEWYVGESGLTGRMSSVIALGQDRAIALHMAPSLAKRPFDPLEEIANQITRGTNVRQEGTKLSIESTLEIPREISVDGSMSSQFISGLLILLCSKGKACTVNLLNPKSMPYIDMTIDILRHFGGKLERNGNAIQIFEGELTGSRYQIEQDWSAIGLLLAATFHGGGGQLAVPDLKSCQADRAVLEFLKDNLSYTDGHLKWVPNELEGLDIDMNDCPDLFPAMAAIAVGAKTASRFKGVGRLAHKESDRGLAIQQEWAKLGLHVEIDGDEMVVYPGKVNGGKVDAHGDHRMAMALAALGLSAESEVVITGAESVGKSYPDFWNDLMELNGQIELSYE